MSKRLLLVSLMAVALFVTACGSEPEPTPEPQAEPTPTTEIFESPIEPGDAQESPIGLPNPASVYCEEQGGRLEFREEAGGTAGYCIFSDGSECEEWAYFRGECEPGSQ